MNTKTIILHITKVISFVVVMFGLNTCLRDQLDNRRKILMLERWKENEVEENLELTKEWEGKKGKYIKLGKSVHFTLV